MRHRQTVREKSGFTLTELMVTLVVIGVLMGLLLPALNMVKSGTLRVKQKAQFHTIEVGLEGFRADMGDYPASYPPYPPTMANELYEYYGAQRLAEALIGRDGFGFHPRSRFRLDGLADLDNDGANDDVVYDVTSENNRKARKGPYVELESANAIRLESYGALYDFVTGPSRDYWLNTYVFADQYRIVKSLTTQLIGMPVLYYKANTSNFMHTDAFNRTDNPPVNNVYMLTDNWRFYSYNNSPHPLANSQMRWYEKTTNPAFPGVAAQPYPRPYRHDSFLLHSAGEDGLYGTEDDVFNFDDNEN